MPVLCCTVLCECSPIVHGCQAPFVYFEKPMVWIFPDRNPRSGSLAYAVKKLIWTF